MAMLHIFPYEKNWVCVGGLSRGPAVGLPLEKSNFDSAWCVCIFSYHTSDEAGVLPVVAYILSASDSHGAFR